MSHICLKSKHIFYSVDLIVHVFNSEKIYFIYKIKNERNENQHVLYIDVEMSISLYVLCILITAWYVLWVVSVLLRN